MKDEVVRMKLKSDCLHFILPYVVADLRLRSWSAMTPTRMTAPITAKLSDEGMPSRLTRFCKTCKSAAPMMMPTTEPSPPRKEQPPSTAAAMPNNSKKFPCEEGETEFV